MRLFELVETHRSDVVDIRVDAHFNGYVVGVRFGTLSGFSYGRAGDIEGAAERLVELLESGGVEVKHRDVRKDG